MSKYKRKIKKPIAILTDDLKFGLHWVITNYSGQLAKYQSNNRKIIMSDGQEMIICTKPEHLLGLEISHWVNAGGNIRPASYINRMMELAETRIR